MNLLKQDKALLCYFGHHKCASTWIMRILYDVCASLRLKSYEKQIILLENPKETMTKEKPDFYFCQTSDYKKVSQLPPFKGFHVIRDARDIIVSGYYSHLYSHATKDWPELADHRERLKNLSKTNGLLAEIEFSKQFIDHIGGWNYKNANILELKYEDLVDDPSGKMRDIFIHLGLYENEVKDSVPYSTLTINKVLSKIGLTSHTKRLALNDSLIEALIKKHSFSKLSGGRERGVADEFSHYRKGISGDWKNHFENIHKEKFIALYGDILVKLGYEKDNSW